MPTATAGQIEMTHDAAAQTLTLIVHLGPGTPSASGNVWRDGVVSNIAAGRAATILRARRSTNR